jgi:NAD(P)-dependent dehydrogenase (short-subunit alcohol dehydrogenase family)
MGEKVFITGASRGIGLGLTKIFLNLGDQVFAACRTPQKNAELQALKQKYTSQLILVSMAVNSDESVKKAAQEVAAQTAQLDLLMNNAGISPGPANAKLEDVDLKNCREAYETNVLGPMRVTREFLSLLRKSRNPRVVHTTSGLASLSGKSEGGFYAYGVSKAALNMLPAPWPSNSKARGSR